MKQPEVTTLVVERPPQVGDLIGFPYSSPILILRITPWTNGRSDAWKVLFLDIKIRYRGTTGFWPQDCYDLLVEAETKDTQSNV